MGERRQPRRIWVPIAVVLGVTVVGLFIVALGRYRGRAAASIGSQPSVRIVDSPSVADVPATVSTVAPPSNAGNHPKPSTAAPSRFPNLSQFRVDPDSTSAPSSANPDLFDFVDRPRTQAEARAAQLAWAKKIGTEVELRNSLGMEMVLIPPGRYRMGSPPSELHRTPLEDQVEVTLTQPFFLGKYEVSAREYASLAFTAEQPNDWEGPARKLTSPSAFDFCARLSEREREANLIADGCLYGLPTEAQWEYSCRAGTHTVYSFGNTARADQARFGNSQAEIDKLKLPGAIRRGDFPPNNFGLYDMHGNIAELCVDQLSALPGGVDPIGKSSIGGERRIARGGFWFWKAEYGRSASRLPNLEGGEGTGLRLAYFARRGPPP